MMYGRQGKVDEDIDFYSIKSKIIRNLIGKLDSYYEDGVYFFVDVQNRFFCNMMDYGAYYEYQESYESMMHRMENDIPPPEPCPSFLASIMKVFYIPPRHRGRGLQGMFLDYILSVSEEESEPVASFVDPFAINGENYGDNASTSFVKFLQDGISPTENWISDSVKQRDRFLKAGFKNVKYEEAQVTQPWQQFLYMPTTAPDSYQETVNRLELKYTVDLERLRQLEPGGL